MSEKRNGTPLAETICSCCGMKFTHKKKIETRGKPRHMCNECKVEKRNNSYYAAKERAMNGEDNYLSRERLITAQRGN